MTPDEGEGEGRPEGPMGGPLREWDTELDPFLAKPLGDAGSDDPYDSEW